jgi:thymidylate synthase (FAD)
MDSIPVLDKGFVRLVEVMGGDHSIVQAARVSYGPGTKSVREDRALIDYLMRHRHTSPFEMVEFKFHVKAPLFVVRQWFRHRTASVNEISGRYSVLKEEFYEPELWRQQAVSPTRRRMGSSARWRRWPTPLTRPFCKRGWPGRWPAWSFP